MCTVNGKEIDQIFSIATIYRYVFGESVVINSHHHDHEGPHEGGHAHEIKRHHHHAVPNGYGGAFVLAIALNTGFVIVEFGFGLIAHSTALMADAGHNLSDVLGLLLAWGATLLAKKQPGGRYTYGLRSTSILAALANAMLLLVACGAIAWEAVRRFSDPPEVAGLTVSIVALAGVVINLVSAWLFMTGGKEDLNIRAAFMHMAADAAVSLGVVIAGLLMFYSGWLWLDPVVSLLIVAVVLIGTWGLLRDSVQLSLSAVPAHIDLQKVQQFLAGLPGVTAVYDLHIWGMSTTENALTVHLIMPEGSPGDSFIEDVSHELEERFAIHHSTVQIQRSSLQRKCALER